MTDNVHTQRFRLGHITLILATGTPQEVVGHVKQQVDNKLNLISVGVRRDSERAMALYIDGFDSQARDTAISSDVIKGILGGYDSKKWNFFSAFVAFDNNVDVTIGGHLLATIQAVAQFAKDFAKSIFGKGGYVAGATNQTKAVLLYAPDAERMLYAWDYETGTATTLPQPFGSQTTRYAFANGLIATQQGASEIRTFSNEQVQAMLNQQIDDPRWNQSFELKGAQIDDLSLGYQTGERSYAVIATGTFNGKPGMKILNVTIDGEDLHIVPATQATIELDEEITALGAVVRFGPDWATFVNRNGGPTTVTQVPMDRLPAQVKNALTQQASAY